MKRNILVSWRGSQGVFARCSSVIQKSFSETTVPWRKRGTQFPCHILLPVTFVPYNSTLVISTNQITFKQRLNCALCHLYFTDCADTEEYRNKVRGDLVEWFASLRDSGCWDWIIVIDSTKARENKVRIQLLEKIKSDFARYSSKIVEVEASNSKMPSMTRSLRDQLVASLDSVVVAYEDYLQAEKEKCYSQDWNLFSYVDSQFSLSQLYGALGLQDQVLAQYDELNALFSVLIWNLSPKGEKPSWLEVFLNESPARCPSLLLNAKATSNSAVALSEGRMSLVEFRVLLLARQLVALLDQYNFRLQSVPSGSIQTQFCGLLLEYADNCLRSIFEELKLLKIEWPDYFRCCWICLFCEEVFHLCARLCDPVQVDSAAENTCHLWVEFCYSLFEVGVACGFVSKRCTGSLECSRNKDLLSWLPDATEVDGCMKQGKDGTSPVSKIQQLLRAKVNFQFQFKKHCENSMAVLKHFKWKRHARMLGKLLADFLIYSDLPNCLESALPYYLKLLNSLAREKWEGAYICLLKETIQHFEQSPSFEHQKLEFFACLAVRTCDRLQRKKWFEKFLEYTEMMDHKLVEKRAHRWFEIEKGLEILPAEPNPGQSVSCGLNFVSNFPVGIEVKLRLCCKQTGRFFNSGPRFRVDLHEDGARVTCPGSHNFLAPRSSEPLPQDCPTGGFCCQTLLEPGVNRVELLTKTGEVGSFITDHLHVVINSFGLEIEIPERFQVLFHVRTELPSAELVRIKSPLYGGIVQKLRLVACPGSVGTNRETVVQLSSDESHLLFRRTSEQAWSDQMDVTVPILDSNSVFNCVLDGLMVLKGLRDATLVSAKGSLEWMDGYRWPFELLFQPLIYSIPRINLVEDRVIFEDRVCSCCLSGSVAIVPTGVTLRDEGSGEEKTQLLNPCLEPIHPEGEYKFVWILSSDSGASHYVVTMNYRFSTEKDSEEYAYVDPVSFDTSKAVYELCCQITSRPLLCRAESQCDLVISLRSLHPERRAESLVIGLEANPTQWHLMEQQKVVSVKESGLGQVTFGVVPRSVGYLPLPSVVLLRKNDDSGNHCLPLKVYVRTEGKQVHVLAPLPKGKGSTSASAPHLPLEF